MRLTEEQFADLQRRRGIAPTVVDAVSETPPSLKMGASKWAKDRQIPHVCKICGESFTSKVPRHLYCEICSESQDLKRKRLVGVQVNRVRRKDERRQKGLEISANGGRSLADPPHQPCLNWKIGIIVPFSWSGSKNAIFALRRQGHVALRRQANEYRDAIIASLKSALRGRRIYQNKLWIDIFVEKSNHKGDAVNFVDLVCDAVKVATDLDDRWYCLRSVDWSIAKSDPNLFICVGQEEVEDVQACSYCGRLLAFEMFSRCRSNKSGITRICKDCSRKDRVVVRPLSGDK